MPTKFDRLWRDVEPWAKFSDFNRAPDVHSSPRWRGGEKAPPGEDATMRRRLGRFGLRLQPDWGSPTFKEDITDG